MTPAEFKTAFPAFAAVLDATVQRHITAAVPFFDVARWDDFYPAGLGNWVAHWITMETLDAAAGIAGAAAAATPALSKQVGSVSVTYSADMLNKQAMNSYWRTSYGQRYLYLLRLVGAGAIAV